MTTLTVSEHYPTIVFLRVTLVQLAPDLDPQHGRQLSVYVLSAAAPLFATNCLSLAHCTNKLCFCVSTLVTPDTLVSTNPFRKK
jgi:hypothetical protein